MMNQTENKGDTMDEELRAIENKLEQLAPMAMPEDMLARMEQAMEKWQETVPIEEKIVAFEPVQQEKGRMRFFNTWASAAAVALIAAASYQVFNGGTISQTAIVHENAPIVAPAAELVPAQNIQNVVTASHSKFGTQVKNASKDVITYDAKGRPMRLMQVEFEDEITVRGRDGEIYKVKQPRIEYYAVPVEMN